MMPHDWGCSVPADLSTEEVIEIRDKLRSGTMDVDLPASLNGHEKLEEWRAELKSQMLAAYEKEAARRRC
jgi:hypothetical protein